MANRLIESFQSVNLTDQELHRFQQNVKRSLDSIERLLLDKSELTKLALSAAQLLVLLKSVDGAASGLDADLLDGAEGSAYQTVAGLLTAILAIDGTGSGIDADLLDGAEGSAYQTVAGLLAAILAIDGTGSGIDADLLDGAEGSAYQTVAGLLAAILTIDGAASGIDADLLDGQHGSYYRDAGNINAGTLAVGRGGTGSTGFGTSALVQADGSGNLATLASPTLAEIAYLSGVTSAIQTQLDAITTIQGATALRVKSVCIVYLDADESLTSTGLAVPWSDAAYDPDNWWDTDPDATLAVPSGLGINYVLSMALVWVSTATGTTWTNARQRVDGGFSYVGLGFNERHNWTGVAQTHTHMPIAFFPATGGSTYFDIFADAGGATHTIKGDASGYGSWCLALGLEVG